MGVDLCQNRSITRHLLISFVLAVKPHSPTTTPHLPRTWLEAPPLGLYSQTLTFPNP